jgi:hypothetical protein
MGTTDRVLSLVSLVGGALAPPALAATHRLDRRPPALAAPRRLEEAA